MRSLFSWITVLLFVSFICIPPFLAFWTAGKKISKFEKRRLAERPQWHWNIEQIKDFPEEFEKYYNDHFGLRDFLVTSHQLFSFKVFNISSSISVTAGNDGWLFFNGNKAFESYLGLIPLSEQKLRSSRQTIKDRRDWLAGMGIKYLFVPVPNKWNIYSEFIPWRIHRLAGKGVYDQILPFLANKSDFTEYTDLQSALLKKKSTGPLYFKTDTHWNAEGAILAYQRILDKLEEQQIFPRRLKQSDVLMEQIEFSGDLAMSLHLSDYLKEISPKFGPIKGCQESQVSREKKEYLAGRFQKFAKDTRPFVMVQGCSENDTSVLFIHDSFGFFLYPLFTKTFGTFFYVNRGIERVKDFIEWVQPDLVIDERVERNLVKSLAPDNDIINGAMEANFYRSKNTKFFLDQSSPNVGSTRDVRVQKESNGWRVHSTGRNPALIINYESGTEDVPLVARIQLTSPEDTACYLRYSQSNLSDGAEQVISMPVEKGFNEFFLRLLDPHGEGKLEFHSGSVAGEYSLHSFIIKRESGL